MLKKVSSISTTNNEIKHQNEDEDTLERTMTVELEKLWATDASKGSVKLKKALKNFFALLKLHSRESANQYLKDGRILNSATGSNIDDELKMDEYIFGIKLLYRYRLPTSQFKLTTKTTNALIKRLDKDHDGIVSEAEFMEFVLPRDLIQSTKRQSIRNKL